MNRENHGDRSVSPRPLSELLAEDEFMKNQDLSEDYTMPEQGQPAQLSADVSAWRQWAVAVAAASFGQVGARTDGELFERSNAIIAYVAHG